MYREGYEGNILSNRVGLFWPLLLLEPYGSKDPRTVPRGLGAGDRVWLPSSFTNFTTGSAHSFGGEYLELVPYERIRYTDKFDGPNLPGNVEVTVVFRKVICGTEINVVQAGLPEVIPVEMCYLGWQESLAQLANLVEPEIAN